MIQIFENPCKQCGYCCKQEVCELGEIVLDNTEPPCQLLVYFDNKYWCGLVLYCKDEELKNEMMEALGIGVGCDANGEKLKVGVLNA